MVLAVKILSLLVLLALPYGMKGQVLPMADLVLLKQHMEPLPPKPAAPKDGLLFGFYRKALKRLILAGGCLYGPSCSYFAQHSYRELNPFTATALTIDRLLRCNSLMISYNRKHLFVRHGHFHDPIWYYAPKASE